MSTKSKPTPGIEAVMARFPVPEQTVTVRGWRVEMRALPQERIWELTQAQAGDPLFDLRVSQALAVASIQSVTAPDGTQLPASVVGDWFKALPNGVSSRLSAIADDLSSSDLDMGFSEPQSPETSDSDAI